MRKFINDNKGIFRRMSIVEYEVIECKDKVDALLVTSSHCLTNLDIEKFNKQYPNLTIKYSNIFHDRFIIIDNTLYHVGASFKDLGKKCFRINKIEDKEYLNKMIEIINQ